MSLDIRQLLKVMVDRDASDIYLTVDLPASYRIQGTVQTIGEEPLTNENLEALALTIMRDRQRKEFEETLEM
ncbi:MAG TPA: type IV pili twitching motility protein PilT, partial [Nitrospiraceae bacterium]|nr:type IV pili twitching motility protein PilT [Nitrospiraceae bacterium]